MAANVREQILSLLAATNNHGDLSVKLSSLKQVKDIILSFSDDDPDISSLSTDVLPFLLELQSSPQPRVRQLFIQVIEEIGLRTLEHTSILMPVLLALLKDEDSGVSRQSIISFKKFFCAAVEEIALQYHRHGKLERWAEDSWVQMVDFKDALCSLVFESASLATRLLAFKFLETFILLFTPDSGDSDMPTSRGNECEFNISWVTSTHPLLDPAKLTSEAKRLATSFLDTLQSPSSLPGPLTIAAVNCVAAIARKRPDHYGNTYPALLDFHSKVEMAKGGHSASLQYSVRSAFLGFLRSTHPFFIEARDKLVRFLRSVNAGDAADQALRQVDKMLRDNERSLRDVRLNKDDQSSNPQLSSGNATKRKLPPVDNEEPANGLGVASKRTRYLSIGKPSELIHMNDSRDGNPTANGISSRVPVLNGNSNPVEEMISLIAALLAEGDRGAESVELLISQIHPDLLADIVISNMKHLPKSPPQAKSVSSPPNVQDMSAGSVVKVPAPDVTLPVQSLPPAPQGSLTTVSTGSTSLLDVTNSSNHAADSKRDPRRDPRRMDPRRNSVPVEASTQPAAEEITNLLSGLETPALVNKTLPLPSCAMGENLSPHSTVDTEVDGTSVKASVVSETKEEISKEEPIDCAQEISDLSRVDMSVKHTASPEFTIEGSLFPPKSLHDLPYDAADASFVLSDYYAPEVSHASSDEETSQELPEVPSYVGLSEDERRAVWKLAVKHIIRSYKQLKSIQFCETKMALLARLVSWMYADDIVAILVQEEIVLNYRDLQGHELVLNVLYHLYGLMTVESCESSGATKLYENFLLGVATCLLDTLPASDKSFSRLLGEAPTLTESVMRLLENFCFSPDSFNMHGQDSRDDRITQGLGVLWTLILGRQTYRQACLTIALKCAVHSEDDIRAKAIRLVGRKLYPLEYLTKEIEQYGTKMFLSAVDCTTDADTLLSPCSDPKSQEATGLETSVSGLQLPETATSDDNVRKGIQAVPQPATIMSVTEAQRLISLYFALCTKRPDLLQLVFSAYARSGRSVKQAIHRNIPTLLRVLGSSYSELLCIISDPPEGSENLLMLVLQVLAEQTTSLPDLIAMVKHLYETKLKDPAIFIPLLPSMSKNEVLPIFPRLVDLPLDKFQQALAHILQGSAHSGPALTPAEVLVAIHAIVPEREGIPLKKVTDACSACFEQRTVFTQHVLAKALNDMVDQTPIPLLFMRTVIQAIGAFPTLVDFVMEILSKLVTRQIWRMPKLWVGFLKCVSQTQPHSFRVLLQLPTPQLEGALNKYPHLRNPLAAYSSQPSITS